MLNDPVVSSLTIHLKHPTAASYAEFVALLNSANGGNLGEHINELCLNSQNVYVKTIGENKSVPSYMRDTLEAELDVLQEIAELDKETLCNSLKYDGLCQTLLLQNCA